MSNLLRKKDFIIIGILLVISVLAFFIYENTCSNNSSTVVITKNGNAEKTFSLDDDVSFDIVDEDGNITNTIEIKNHSVHMADANCPDKLCINQGIIKDSSKPIVCLPNKVVVSIESAKENEYDTIAQ